MIVRASSTTCAAVISKSSSTAKPDPITGPSLHVVTLNLTTEERTLETSSDQSLGSVEGDGVLGDASRGSTPAAVSVITTVVATFGVSELVKVVEASGC